MTVVVKEKVCSNRNFPCDPPIPIQLELTSEFPEIPGQLVPRLSDSHTSHTDTSPTTLICSGFLGCPCHAYNRFMTSTMFSIGLKGKTTHRSKAIAWVLRVLKSGQAGYTLEWHGLEGQGNNWKTYKRRRGGKKTIGH
ncbi:hypothetical protein L218DRAFT_949712 [Marasmius fiardii PR-910]|nr:hypothetical protein L218DRAFT_949712 [Marasmius fiardii PR-910]